MSVAEERMARRVLRRQWNAPISKSARPTTLRLTRLAAAEAAAEAAMIATVPLDAAESSTVEDQSAQIRQAMECPVCLTLATDVMCLCPNGHILCRGCVIRLLRSQSCPMCRARFTFSRKGLDKADELSRYMAKTLVTCAHRPNGCPQLHAVSAVERHEAKCPYAPDVHCLAFGCQWVGFSDQLFEHVLGAHQNVAVDAPTNHLVVDDLTVVTRNRRLTRLVRTPSGLFWAVVVQAPELNRVRAGVFRVVSSASRKAQQPLAHGDVSYTVTTAAGRGRKRAGWLKAKVRAVGRTSTLADGDHGDGLVGDPDGQWYTKVWSNLGSLKFHIDNGR